MSKRVYFLQGKLCGLRPIEQEDMPLIAKWLNDGEITYYMFYGQTPLTISQVSEMMKRQIESPNNMVLLVEDKKTGKPIGFAGLYDIHPTARKAEFRILLGEKQYWNKGYGTEVTEVLTFYGFDRLNLNRVWLGVTSENKGAVKAYEKVEYKVEGTLRQDIYRNSRYYDTIRMSILREEYYPKIHAEHRKRFAPSQPKPAKKEK